MNTTIQLQYLTQVKWTMTQTQVFTLPFAELLGLKAV